MAEKMGDLTVRVVAVGHASARWKGAKNSAEADRKNQALSEMRAQNVRTFMEKILQKELPGSIQLGVTPKGVGRLQPLWPEKPTDDSAINRSVVVTVEVTGTGRNLTLVRGTQRINARTKYWSVRVVDFHRIAAGASVGEFTIILKNPVSGKEMKGRALVAGGGTPEIPKISDATHNGGDVELKQIGKECYFETREALGFDDFDGTAISTAKVKVKLVYGNEMTYIKFPLLNHDPDLLVFNYKEGFGWGAEGFYMSGELSLQGRNPGDYYEVPTISDLVEVPNRLSSGDGMLLSFPTGRADLHSLTAADRKRLEDFTINKARNIAALGNFFALSAAS